MSYLFTHLFILEKFMRILSTFLYQRSKENPPAVMHISFTQIGIGTGAVWAYDKDRLLEEVASRWNEPKPEFRVLSYLRLKHSVQEMGAQTSPSAE